ncbi:MAG TPA: hypothetical protein VFQ47_08210 [Nitrososphaera sp.]|jgi:hypothetical protein|nr:hypothetical protein [Nitrososphaera sp.]
MSLIQKLRESSNLLPTEYPFRQAIAIYSRRIALLAASALLTAWLLVLILLVVNNSLYFLLIVSVIFPIIGLRVLLSRRDQSSIHDHQANSIANLSRVEEDKQLRKLRKGINRIASSRGEQTLRHAEITRLSAESEVLENYLHQLELGKSVLQTRFSHNLQRWDYDVPDYEAPPFAIPEDTRIAKISFWAAVAIIICQGLLLGWGITPLGLFWLGPLIAILMAFIFQGLIFMIFCVRHNPSHSVSRISTRVLFPFVIVLVISFFWFVLYRLNTIDNLTNISALLGVSFWMVTLTLPIVAGALLSIAQSMSWSKTIEQEYNELNKKRVEVYALRTRLQGELRFLLETTETDHHGQREEKLAER